VNDTVATGGVGVSDWLAASTSGGMTIQLFTPDSAPSASTNVGFQDLQELTKKLLAVPKSETVAPSSHSQKAGEQLTAELLGDSVDAERLDESLRQAKAGQRHPRKRDTE